MALTLERVKSHLRVPHDMDDEDITLYMEFAESDVIEAVFDSYDEELNKDKLRDDPTFKRGVLMLTTFYYENRMNISELKQVETPYSVTHAIQTLRAHKDRYYA